MAIEPEKLKKMYGDEYPAAVMSEGTRLPLALELRFTRDYRVSKEDEKTAKVGGVIVSRFLDGSASMTAAQLRHEWPTMTEWEQVDFCQSCSWLYKQSDFPEMLRFIMQHGGPETWSSIAIKVGTYLPRAEAFGFLVHALNAVDVKKCANIVHGVAITKHPEAASVIRKQLQVIWEHPDMWKDDSFLNWVAWSALSCIELLMELGASPAEFEAQVRKLSEHVCVGNREDCQRFLGKYYGWLNG